MIYVAMFLSPVLLKQYEILYVKARPQKVNVGLVSNNGHANHAAKSLGYVRLDIAAVGVLARLLIDSQVGENRLARSYRVNELLDCAVVARANRLAYVERFYEASSMEYVKLLIDLVHVFRCYSLRNWKQIFKKKKKEKSPKISSYKSSYQKVLN